MKNSLSPFGKTIIKTVYEYLLIVVPVGVYVALEAIHKDKLSWFFLSPEWAIASIFLAFQTCALYIKYLDRTHKKLNNNLIYLLLIFAFILSITATINAFISLEDNNWKTILFRTIHFILTSVLFSFFVSGAILKTFTITEQSK